MGGEDSLGDGFDDLGACMVFRRAEGSRDSAQERGSFERRLLGGRRKEIYEGEKAVREVDGEDGGGIGDVDLWTYLCPEVEAEG